MRRPPPLAFGACLLLLLAGCGDAPANRSAGGGGAGPQRLADRIAAGMADALHATLVARTDPRLLAVLEAPETVEILALHPSDAGSLADSDGEAERALAGRPQFHGYPVLGRKTLEDAAARTGIVTLVAEGIARSGEDVADCFFPRHGLRLTGAGLTLDLVVCYECEQMNVYGLPGITLGNANTSPVVEPRVTAFFEARGLQISEE